MNSAVEWNIKPEEILRRAGLHFRRSGKFLSPKTCIFCQGGDSRDVYTLAIHHQDGNFKCLRSTCSQYGSFWKLIEALGFDPKEFREGSSGIGQRSGKGKKKKGYIYGRK